MTYPLRHRQACLAGALLASFLLPACGSEAKQVEDGPGASPTGEATSTATCAELIPDDALAPLTWTGMATATADPDGCSRSAAEGSVRVVRLAVAATGGEDLPEKVEAAYTERCNELDLVSEEAATDNPLEPTPGEEVDWLGPAPACVVAPDMSSPESALLTVTESQALVEIRVTTETPTDARKVQDALVLLARTADEVVTDPQPS